MNQIPELHLLVTLACWLAAERLNRVSGGKDWLNPAALAIIAVAAWISLSGCGYETYMKGAAPVHLMLGPATVAMAVPLFKYRKALRSALISVSTGALVAVPLSPALAVMIGRMSGAAPELVRASVTKSVTTAIAAPMAPLFGADPAPAIMFVFLSGLTGCVAGPALLRALGLRDERALGFALGCVSHGLGMAGAFRLGETTGVYAAIGMGVGGAASAFVLPYLFPGVIRLP